MKTISITTEEANQRLDRFLRKKLEHILLTTIYKIIRTGKVKVNGRKRKERYRLKIDDKVTFFLSEDEFTKKKTVRKKTFTALYEDEDILVVNKPPFLASQPGTGVEKNNLVNQVKAYLKESKSKPALANRIDRGTSGVVVVGKNKKTILALYDIFKNKRIKKYYLALVKGNIQDNQGVLRLFLRRVKERFKHKVIVAEGSEEGAILTQTKFKVVKRFKEYTLVELELMTGKMHQIRLQLRHAGYPIVGDPTYGDSEVNKVWKNILRRQFLHANKVEFLHPFKKKRIVGEAPLPDDLREVLEKIV